jgi:predicted PurR-regulated permease PerM
MKELNFQNLFRTTVVLVFGIALVYILIIAQKIIVPLIVAFFMAFLLMPLCKWLESKKFPTVLAAITSLLVAIVGLAGVVVLFGSQVKRFTKDFDQIAGRIAEIRESLPQQIQSRLADFKTEDVAQFFEENVGEIFQGLAGFVSSFTFVIIVPIYIVLILVYRRLFKTFLLRVFEGNENTDSSEQRAEENIENGDKRNMRELIPRIKQIVQKYIQGMFYVICILFVLNSIALISLGIEHALLFAAFAAVLNIIPFVGPMLGSLLPILFALLTKDSMFYPVAVLVAFVIIQTAESNLITPNIVGRNVSLNPLVSLLALFIGASIWGVVGMILFIPLIAILKEIFASIEGLEPYAYVLGVGDQEESEPNAVERWYRRVKEKLSGGER